MYSKGCSAGCRSDWGRGGPLGDQDPGSVSMDVTAARRLRLGCCGLRRGHGLTGALRVWPAPRHTAAWASGGESLTRMSLGSHQGWQAAHRHRILFRWGGGCGALTQHNLHGGLAGQAGSGHWPHGTQAGRAGRDCLPQDRGRPNPCPTEKAEQKKDTQTRPRIT